MKTAASNWTAVEIKVRLIKKDMPQESILDQLLYIIYTSYLSNFYDMMFADDTSTICS